MTDDRMEKHEDEGIGERDGTWDDRKYFLEDNLVSKLNMRKWIFEEKDDQMKWRWILLTYSLYDTGYFKDTVYCNDSQSSVIIFARILGTLLNPKVEKRYLLVHDDDDIWWLDSDHIS